MGSNRHQYDADATRKTTGNEHLDRDTHLHNGHIILFMLHRMLTSTHKMNLTFPIRLL